jgi:ubiquinone/menaquinone biosynthesis C-methylase UbiE
MSKRMRYGAVAAAGAVVVLGAWFGPAIAFHVLPHHRSGEADRLAAALGVHAGSTVAEIGAGTGWLSVAMAERVGSDGRVYATEIAGDKRAQIAERARTGGLANIEVREARERDPALPPGCCDAVFMRNVLHHIDDWPAYVRALAPVLRPGGRVAIIDFAPGAFFHLGGDHGAPPDRVVEAFRRAGFEPAAAPSDWGGRMYLLVFRLRSPEAGAG